MIPRIADTGKQNGIPFVVVEDCSNFSVHKTFDCGQAFRFDPVDGDTSRFSGIAVGEKITFEQPSNGVIRIVGTDEDGYERVTRALEDTPRGNRRLDFGKLREMIERRVAKYSG